MPDTFDHKGYQIVITGEGKFAIRDTDGEHGDFPTLAAAKSKIDELVKENREELHLPALTLVGEPITIRTLHRGNGDVLIHEDKERRGTVSVDAPWLRELMLEKVSLEERIKNIDHEIFGFRITRRSYGGRETNSHTVEAFVETYHAKTKAAQEIQAERDGEDDGSGR